MQDIQKYDALIRRLAERAISNQELAKDAAQEAWIEVLHSLEKFRQESDISTFIYTIAYRKICHYAARERTYSTRFLRSFFQGAEHHVPAECNEGDGSYQLWIKDMCNQCITGVLRCLDEKSRLIYILREQCDLSYDELRMITGENNQNLRKIYSRSSAKVRKFMQGECALFNKNGKCNCRMKSHMKHSDIKKEFDKWFHTINKVRFLKAADKVLSPSSIK